MKKLVILFMAMIFSAAVSYADQNTRFGIGLQGGIWGDSMNTDKFDDIKNAENKSGEHTLLGGGYAFIEQVVKGFDSETKGFLGVRIAYNVHTEAKIDVRVKGATPVNAGATSWANSTQILLYYKMDNVYAPALWWFGGGVTLYKVGWKDSKMIYPTNPLLNAFAPDITKDSIQYTAAIGMELKLSKRFALELEGDININNGKIYNNLIVVTNGYHDTEIYRDLSWFNLKMAVKYYIF